MLYSKQNGWIYTYHAVYSTMFALHSIGDNIILLIKGIDEVLNDLIL